MHLPLNSRVVARLTAFCSSLVDCVASVHILESVAPAPIQHDQEMFRIESFCKNRLLQYDADFKSGKELSEQQNEARYCIGEVETQLDFFNELGKMLSVLQKEYHRSLKRKEENVKKDQAEDERKLLLDFINYRYVVEQFDREDVKKAFIDGSDDTVKISEEEYQMIEDLSHFFGLKMSISDGFLKYREKCEKNVKSAHKVLTGSKEKLVGRFSGAEIKKLLDEIVNCEFTRDAKEELLDKPKEHPLESPKEQLKDGPKVNYLTN
ncbi:unnamed protein product [Gongylonema pulchrum]|uniref:Caprin-1_dimer domain-containing protein n=1 Tax=Gongylonema pulchrum TaxID=637853 RepID=A0A183ECA8_9BILA|nr:unnamed protein product [Gongylonema pulchrum]